MGKAAQRKRFRKPVKKDKPWLQKKKKLQQGEGRPQAIAKWVHHALKLLHKALKKARLFEQRKAGRRLSQLKDKSSSGDAEAATQVQKVQQQLEAIRTADLQTLTKQALVGLHLKFGTTEIEDEVCTPSSLQGVEELPTARAAAEVSTQMAIKIASSHCVKQQLESLAQDFNIKFGVAKPKGDEDKSEGTQTEPQDVEAVLAKLKRKREANNSEDDDAPDGDALEADADGRGEPEVKRACPAQDKSTRQTIGKDRNVTVVTDEGQDDNQIMHRNGTHRDPQIRDSGNSSDDSSGGDEEEDNSEGNSSDEVPGLVPVDMDDGDSEDGSEGEDELEVVDGSDEVEEEEEDLGSFDSAQFDQPAGGQVDVEEEVSGGAREDSDVAISDSDWEDLSDLDVTDKDSDDGEDVLGSRDGKNHALTHTGKKQKQTKNKAHDVAAERHKQKGDVSLHSEETVGMPGGMKAAQGQINKKKKAVEGASTAKKALKAQAKRLGQRARRMLYEKMYGGRARHLQQQGNHSRTSQAHGLRPPRGGGAAVFQQGTASRAQQEWSGRSTSHKPGHKAPVDGKGTGNKVASQPEELHPSWQAKRQQAQKLVISKNVQAAKKVVFDEDDD